METTLRNFQKMTWTWGGEGPISYDTNPLRMEDKTGGPELHVLLPVTLQTLGFRLVLWACPQAVKSISPRKGKSVAGMGQDSDRPPPWGRRLCPRSHTHST